MSKSSSRELQEVMTAVDAGHSVDSESSDSSKLLGPRRRGSSTYYGGRGGARESAPAVAAVEASPSFEFSTAVVAEFYSSASPASMVFSDGKLQAHQFPAVRSSAAAAAAAASPVRSSSIGGYGTKQQQQQAAGMTTTGTKKRVSFATDGPPDKAAGGQRKKSGGLLGCCGSHNEVAEPVARNHDRKVVAV